MPKRLRRMPNFAATVFTGSAIVFRWARFSTDDGIIIISDGPHHLPMQPRRPFGSRRARDTKHKKVPVLSLSLSLALDVIHFRTFRYNTKSPEAEAIISPF